MENNSHQDKDYIIYEKNFHIHQNDVVHDHMMAFNFQIHLVIIKPLQNGYNNHHTPIIKTRIVMKVFLY